MARYRQLVPLLDKQLPDGIGPMLAERFQVKVNIELSEEKLYYICLRLFVRPLLMISYDVAYVEDTIFA